MNLPFRNKKRWVYKARCCNSLNKGNYLATTMLFNIWILLSPTADHLCLCRLTKKESFLIDIRNCIWLDMGVNQGSEFSKMIFDCKWIVGMYSLTANSPSISCCKFRVPIEELCNPVPSDVGAGGLTISLSPFCENINFFPQTIQSWWEPPVIWLQNPLNYGFFSSRRQ